MSNSRLSLLVWQAISIKSHNESQKLLKKWRFAELFSAVFSLFGILSASSEYELSFSSDRDNENCKENPNQALRSLTLVFTGISVYFLILRHRVKCEWRNKKMLAQSMSNNNGKRKNMWSQRLVAELVILALFPYPFFRANVTLHQPSIKETNEKWSNLVPLCYNLAEFLYVAMFLRLFFIFRAAFNYTPFQDNHARYYCEKLKTRANFRFSLRSMMKTRPFMLIYIMSSISFLLLGVIIRVFERPYSNVSGLNYESFENSIWNMAITMATVGYGDLYPCTTFGRIFGVIGALWGSFVFSMIVFTFQSMFQLDRNQKQAFLSIKHTRAAARVIIACLYYQINKKNHGPGSLAAKKSFRRVAERLQKFNETIKKLRQVDTCIGKTKEKSKFNQVSKQISILDKNIDLLIQKKNQHLKK